MALIGNRSVLHKSPGRFLSGAVASIDRANFNKHGMMRNAFETLSPLSAIPSGHLSPSAWVLPKKPGAMASRNAANSVAIAFGTGALGINISGQASSFSDAVGTGSLIVSGSGTAVSTSSASGTVSAALLGSGTAISTSTASGTISAIGFMSGTAFSTSTASLVAYAVGNMSGTSSTTTALSPEGLAAAVWAATTRTLTSGGGSGGGATAAEIWSYASRNLTGQVYADIRYVNGVMIKGTGAPGDTWGPV